MSFVLSAFASDDSYKQWGHLVSKAGNLYMEGRYAEGKNVAQESLLLAEKIFPLDHPNIANSLRILGRIYHKQAKYSDAESLYKRALGLDANYKGSPAPAMDLDYLAENYEIQGRYTEAKLMYEQTIPYWEAAILTTEKSGDSDSLLRELTRYAKALRGAGKTQEVILVEERISKIRINKQ